MHTPHVLVVDDDRDTRELYAIVYQEVGYTVSQAGTVESGFRMAEERRPDVVLTDWMLPDGDGMALCRAMRRHGPTRRIPMLGATGLTLSPALRAEAHRLGCETVLTKPVDLDTLLRVTTDALQMGQSRPLRAASVRLRRFVALARQSATTQSPDRALTAADLLSASKKRVGSAIALVIADDSGHYLGANARASELTGYDPDELTRMSIEDLTPAPQASTAGHLWSTFIADGAQEGVYLLKRRDGVAVPMRYVAVANIAPGLHLSALSPTLIVDASTPS